MAIPASANRHREPRHRPHPLAQHEPAEDRGHERGGADDEERVRHRGQEQREHVARRSEAEAQGNHEAGPSRRDECVNHAGAITEHEVEGDHHEEGERTVEENLPAARGLDVAQGDPGEAEHRPGGEHERDAGRMASLVGARRGGARAGSMGSPGRTRQWMGGAGRPARAREASYHRAAPATVRTSAQPPTARRQHVRSPPIPIPIDAFRSAGLLLPRRDDDSTRERMR